ncbi:protein TOXD [Uncinocarpus reesii 1704]|uniref:Protein TOXD n=1 Tax=Uncinocarpus reesii (strain UAMH 1704) TaxID=336963 RepID=C4JEI7_UNCRE|nr:protein TOXD [Uncinocarpus reesii 1704]EEP75979.1 protein TOXD [Uncinocarpus reesii 1704]
MLFGKLEARCCKGAQDKRTVWRIGLPGIQWPSSHRKSTPEDFRGSGRLAVPDPEIERALGRRIITSDHRASGPCIDVFPVGGVQGDSNGLDQDAVVWNNGNMRDGGKLNNLPSDPELLPNNRTTNKRTPSILSMLSTKSRWALPSTAHSLTQPSTRSSSPAVTSRPHLAIRYASTPPASPFPAIDARLSSMIPPDVEKSNDGDYQLKLALTDLLNCSDIKSDQEVRRWVQNRLMDTEHRLKARRKSRIMHFER